MINETLVERVARLEALIEKWATPATDVEREIERLLKAGQPRKAVVAALRGTGRNTSPANLYKKIAVVQKKLQALEALSQ